MLTSKNFTATFAQSNLRFEKFERPNLLQSVRKSNQTEELAAHNTVKMYVIDQRTVRLHIDGLGTEFVLKQFKIRKHSKDQIFYN